MKIKANESSIEVIQRVGQRLLWNHLHCSSRCGAKGTNCVGWEEYIMVENASTVKSCCLFRVRYQEQLLQKSSDAVSQAAQGELGPLVHFSVL